MRVVGVLAGRWSRITVGSVGILESFSSVGFFFFFFQMNQITGCRGL